MTAALQTRTSVMRGAASVEWLLAAPMVLILGLSVLQWGLVFFGRSAIEFALQQAAREGSYGHALTTPIEAGLARGLLPFWGLATPGLPLDASLPLGLQRLALEKGNSVLRWRQLAPTRESFQDWAVPARDALGEEIAGMVEIPNDALQFQSAAAGSASGQTIRDANLLKLEMRYGLPLKVPLVAPIAVMVMEKLNGCASAGVAADPLAAPAAGAWACPFYRAADEAGRAQLRWPVQVVATVRMQTTARTSEATPWRKESPLTVARSTGDPVLTPGPGTSGSATESASSAGSGIQAGNTGSTAEATGDPAASSSPADEDAAAGAGERAVSQAGSGSGAGGASGEPSSGNGQTLISDLLSRNGSAGLEGSSCKAPAGT